MVEVTNTWQEGANTYNCIVAKSGEGKTPIEKLVSAPRVALEAALREEYEKEMEDYREAMAEYTKAMKKGGGEYEGDKPVKPRLIRCTMDDFTMETLPRNLKDNPKGIGIVKDEFNSLFIQSTKYSAKGDNGMIQILISGYNYVLIVVDRVDEAKNIFIPYSCFSLRGMIQPSVLYSIISENDIQSGFVSRFSFTYGDRQNLVSLFDEGVSAECRKDWEDIIIRLASIDLVPGSDEIPKVIHLSPDAKELLNSVFMSISIRKERSFNDLLRSFYSKLPEKILRYTNILHHLYLAENYSDPDWFTDVPVEVVQKAVKVGTWVECHFQRFMSEYNRYHFEQMMKSKNPDKYKAQPPKMTSLQRCLDEILSELREYIEEHDGNVPYELLNQKLTERLGREVKTKEYDDYLSSMGCVSVRNIRIPGSNMRGRGRRISKNVFERVSSVSSSQNAVMPSASTSSTETSVSTLVSSPVSNVSLPTEYIV